jgi:hypothetical protein
MNSLHNTIELTEIPQGDILFNENKNMVSLQHMYTLGVPNISHRWHQINIVILSSLHTSHYLIKAININETGFTG